MLVEGEPKMDCIGTTFFLQFLGVQDRLSWTRFFEAEEVQLSYLCYRLCPECFDSKVNRTNPTTRCVWLLM